jgi:hypothetical protein
MRVCIDTNVLVQLFGQNQVGRSTRRVNTPCPRAALKSVRAIPNPRPEDRRLCLKSEARRPQAEIRRPKPEAERGSAFFRPSTFGLRISGLQNMIFPQLAGL